MARYRFLTHSISTICLLFTSVTHPVFAESGYEETVISSLQKIQDAEVDISLDAINGIIEQYPNSKIGHLILADILSMRAGSKNLIKNYNDDSTQLNGLRDELRYRWQHKIESPAHLGLVPANLLLMAPNQEHILVVDASIARLYVYRNNGRTLDLVDDFYMTVGKSGMGKNVEGDLRTPVGVYHVTSYLSGDTLPDRYGPGAFPINYPNQFDKYNNRTGYGIWIHGTESDNYNRVPLASDGCVSLSNDEFLQVAQYVKTDGTTPVIVSDSFQWADPQLLKEWNADFIDLIIQWKNDWEKQDHEKYIRHYSNTEFNNSQHNYESWSKHKQNVNNSKEYIKIGVENLSMFNYPGEQNLVMMSFDQSYESNNYNSKSRKTLFWKQNSDGDWKIIYEG